MQYNVLKREMESDQAVYESVLTRIKQVDVSKGHGDAAAVGSPTGDDTYRAGFTRMRKRP